MVLSDIVIKETKKHIAEQIKKVCRISRKLRTEVLQNSSEYLINYVGLNQILELVDDKKSLAAKGIEMYENFLKEVDAEILNTDLINLDTIIDDYFEIRPPFEQGEKKRKEFPDAFIASQIRERFGKSEVVAIISNDKGFKAACQNTPNHLFFDSLGTLYNTINEEKAAYNDTITILETLQNQISFMISEDIKQNKTIDVRGLSYDKDGVASGFDYSEFELENIANLSFVVYSVDELSEEKSLVTLDCRANILVTCFYEDFDNAPWDSENKEYIFVDTIKMREEHSANFGCRIELDRKTKEFKIFPFMVILNGDSRKERYVVGNNSDYEQEIHDRDREQLGFKQLGSYESFLEDTLPYSDMSQKIIEQFEKMNALHRAYEDFSANYDSLSERLNDHDNAVKLIAIISKELQGISDFPNDIHVNNLCEEEIEEVKNWAISKSDNTYAISEEANLPDVLNYGENIIIKGVDGSEVVLAIDELNLSPVEGSDEIIDVKLSNSIECLATGYVKLTVGYLSFDEDGGVADGIEDDVEYNYIEIVEKINSFISEQDKKREKESEIVEIIKNAVSLV